MLILMIDNYDSLMNEYKLSTDTHLPFMGAMSIREIDKIKYDDNKFRYMFNKKLKI
ncbi:MAG TPA: hypothetical protein VF839_13520 [Clostridium sp.]